MKYLILGDSGVYHKMEQYAVVTGTKQEFARIVDTTENATRIQAYGIRYNLANNLVESIPLEGSRSKQNLKLRRVVAVIAGKVSPDTDS